MDELVDYEWLVPNVSGVFALLSHLLNQSEAFFLPTQWTRGPDQGDFLSCWHICSFWQISSIPTPALHPLLLHG